MMMVFVLRALNYEKSRKQSDWDKRFGSELEKLCDKYRGSNGNSYDCAIAVSGGKDSHMQTLCYERKIENESNSNLNCWKCRLDRCW